METDAAVLERISSACATLERPEHFTEYRHCCECAEHDMVLRERDLEALRIEDVGNAAWDPICFVRADAFIYLLPALARLALAPSDPYFGTYAPQLLFHLVSDGVANARREAATPEQREAVVGLLEHLVETRSDLLGDSADELIRALEIWSA